MNFQRVKDKHFLGITKRGSDGFVATGISVIKKKKLLELASKEVSSEEDLSLISEKADNETQTTSEEATSEEATSEKPQITFEEAIMSVNNEVIVDESITVSDEFLDEKLFNDNFGFDVCISKYVFDYCCFSLQLLFWLLLI